MAPSELEEEIFARALEEPVEGRSALIARECGGDAVQIGRIEALLAAHQQAGAFLNGHPLADSALFAEGERTAWPAEEVAGAQIGRYRIREKIGEGGGGTVYLAEQSEPVSRLVALKIIKLGMDTLDVIARFEGERQALAMMEHSNIARVFDAGATATGRPFFVMELVRGTRITQHCDRNGLTLAERLGLFSDVCRAIEHAHQKGVIHRDIKPSNILVTQDAGVASVKVIDFGIAKATHGRLTDRTLLTSVDQFIGTPAYMSPEQTRMGEWDIDTRSDIYSLGVLLYELLTGRTPFDSGDEAKADREELLRRIRTEEPARPSAVFAAMDELERLKVSVNRRLEAPKLAARVRGELDWIALRCLEKDRTRRYATAGALACDVQRFLSNEPVEAGPPDKMYLALKFARRHRGALAATGTVVAVLIAAVAVSAALAVRATRAERRAAAESAVSQEVRNFLENDLLAQASPDQQPNRDLSLRTVLDRAARRMEGRFPDRPLVEASLRETIGQTYDSLGDSNAQVAQLERAKQLYERSIGPDDPRTLKVAGILATGYATIGATDRAESLERYTLGRLQSTLGAVAPLTIKAQCELLYILCAEFRYAEAEALGEPTLALARQVLGPDDETTREAMNNLSSAYWSQRKMVQAERLTQETVAAQTRVLGPEAPDTLSALSNLASIYWAEDELARSEASNLKLLAIRQRLLGPEHRETLRSMNNLATTYRDEGKLDQAATLAEAAFATRKRLLGMEHNDTISSALNLAAVYAYQHRAAEAEAMAAPALAASQKKLGMSHPATLVATNVLAVIWEQQKRWPEEQALLQQALAVRNALSPLKNAVLQATLDDLGGVFLLEGKYSAATEVLRSALAGHRALWPDQWKTFSCQSQLGAALAGEGKRSEAEPLLRRGLAGLVERGKRGRLPIDGQAALTAAEENLSRFCSRRPATSRISCQRINLLRVSIDL